jgi:lysophospholipase L1-like esterase
MTRGLQFAALAAAVTVTFLAAGAGAGASSPLRYVALGDSFSSGEGNRPYREGTDRLLPYDRCHRSDVAYPVLVRRARPGGTWGFWACSGAQISDMTHPNHAYPSETAQLDRIAPPGRTDPRVALVTLTIGGNDAQFGTAVECIASQVVAPFLCPADWQATVLAGTRRLRSTLPPVLRALRARAPNARILLLGYPDPFPAALRPGSPCSRSFTAADIAWATRESARLNEVIRAAAAAAGARITYVPPSGFAGHDVCSRDPWFNGLLLGPDRFGGSFHPNALGQRRLAREVLAKL